MMKYKDYKIEDYLRDERFVRSVLEPTDDAQRYWDALIEAGALDIYTYTDAILLLSAWRDCQLKPSSEELQAIWQKIEEETHRDPSVTKTDGGGATGISRKGREILLPLSAALAAGIAAVLLLTWPPRTGQRTPEVLKVEPGFVIKSQAQEADKVVIISDQTQMELEGSNPAISYDREGLVSVRESPAPEHARKPLQAPSADSASPAATPSPASAAAPTTAWNQVVVPYGKMASLELSDGSVLRINAGTTVAYPQTFPDGTREIHVDGEVFADIAHDGRPFIVHTKDMEVLVKGTRFNLSAYTSDPFSQVVLVEGRVDVTMDGNDVSLTPGQAFTAEPEGTSVLIVDTDLYTSWTRGVYKFENEPIENVLVKLARFYNVTLVLPETSSGVICYGSLELRDKLSSILSGLMDIASFNFVIKDGAYVIRWNK